MRKVCCPGFRRSSLVQSGSSFRRKAGRVSGHQQELAAPALGGSLQLLPHLQFSAVTASTRALPCEKLFDTHHLISSLSSSRQVVIIWLTMSLRGFSETKKTGSSAVKHPRRSDVQSSTFAFCCLVLKKHTSLRRDIQEGLYVILGWEGTHFRPLNC